jgi:hypothetical protein
VHGKAGRLLKGFARGQVGPPFHTDLRPETLRENPLVATHRRIVISRARRSQGCWVPDFLTQVPCSFVGHVSVVCDRLVECQRGRSGPETLVRCTSRATPRDRGRAGAEVVQMSWKAAEARIALGLETAQMSIAANDRGRDRRRKPASPDRECNRHRNRRGHLWPSRRPK